MATVTTDIYGALLDLFTDIRSALQEHDDLLSVDDVESLSDAIIWRFAMYDDGDRDAYLDPQSNITFTPIWKDSYAFEFLDKQPLSRQQAMRVNQVLNRFGLEIVASLVSKDQATVYLGATSDLYPSSMRDQYLGDVRVWRNAPRAVANATNLFASAVTDLIQRLALDPSHTVIVPCLTSSEAKPSPTGVLPSIARACSEEAHIRFSNSVISKRRHTPLASLRSAQERQQAVAAAKYAAGRPLNAHHVLILDDFITRGDTMSAVASAIREANANVDSVYGVALGKNEGLSFLERYEHKASNDHVPDRWLAQWPLEA